VRSSPEINNVFGDSRKTASLECSNVVLRHVKPRSVREAVGPRFRACGCEGAKVIGFTEVIPSNHLYEGQLISQGHKLLPTSIKKPIVTPLIEVLEAEMCEYPSADGGSIFTAELSDIEEIIGRRYAGVTIRKSTTPA